MKNILNGEEGYWKINTFPKEGESSKEGIATSSLAYHPYLTYQALLVLVLDPL